LTDGLGELVGMSAECVDVADGGRGSSVAEEHSERLNSFLVVIVKIPELFSKSELKSRTSEGNLCLP